MITEKLYELDSHMRTFDAVVTQCDNDNGQWKIVLDRTAFFPEGGGQLADTGRIGSAVVSDVQIKNGIITHYTDSPIEAGESVACEIDWEQRFRRMQNHSGEHIVSGHIHRLFGFNNVGFHMGSEDVTLDIDGVLTETDIRLIEKLANETVVSNVAVTAVYPSAQELEGMEYRSKIELTEAVRIVTVEGCDRCACCAPHVSQTGEIGIIKLLDFMSHKGGVRIHMQCGMNALEDYEQRYQNVRAISGMLSAKQCDVAQAVERFQNEFYAQKQELLRVRREYIDMRAAMLEATDGDICIIESGLDKEDIRRLADTAADRCGGICAVFSGDDQSGYIYNITSRHVDLTALRQEINALINGKGGGSSEMITGKAMCSREDAEVMLQKLSR